MNTKKYVSLDKLGLYDEKIKKVITDSDTATLNSAKSYADSLGANYEKSGTVATAQEALQKNIDAVQANVDIAQAAADKAQGEIDALETYVGTLPDGSAATSVVDYVNIKTAGIATDSALEELNNQVSGIQGVVNGITADYLKGADKTELSDAIKAEENRAKGIEGGLRTDVDAIKNNYLKDTDKTELQGNIDAVVEDVAEIAGDYLKAADKTELEGKINAKAAQTALDAEIERATGIEGGLRTDVDVIKGDYLKAADKTELQGNINTVSAAVERLTNGVSADEVDGVNDLIQYVKDHGTEVTGMQEGIADNAEAIEGVAGRMDTAEGKITALEGAVATKVEQSAYDTKVKALEDADSALSGRIGTLEAINHDAYIAADATLKSELNGEIAKKADASVVTAMDTAYKAADDELSGRLDAVEAQLGDGEGSVADLIADAKAEAIEAAGKEADTKDATVLANAKTYADGLDEAMDARVQALEAIDHDHSNKTVLDGITSDKVTGWDNAAGKAHEHSNLSVLEAITAAKTAAWDAAEQAAKTYADGLNTAMDTRVASLESWHENFVECSQEDINGLFTA